MYPFETRPPQQGAGFAAARITLATVLALGLVLSAAGVATEPQGQESEISPKLAAGGAVFLENDLQAAKESMTVFREFRRQMRRVDELEVIDKDEDADFIAILSGDRDVLGRGKITNQGLPYPDAYSSTKPMILLIYEAESGILLWFDAEPWETRGNTGSMVSHERLVKRLAAAMESASPG